MATTTQPVTTDATKQLVKYRTENGVAVIEMNDPPANTYTYEMNRQLDDAIDGFDQRLRHLLDYREHHWPAWIQRSSITSACMQMKCCCGWNTLPSW